MSNDLPQEDTPGKRIRQTPDVVQDFPGESLQMPTDQTPNHAQKNPLVGSGFSMDKSSGPVQQLVAMFGALVAQGKKAAGSLDILISSISSDLLAEVVMANMQHLPSTCPNTDKEDGLASKMDYPSSVLPAVQLSSLISDIHSLTRLSPLLASLLNVQPPALHDMDVSF